MSHEPQIQARAAQHYVAIPATVAMDGIAAAVDDAFPELFGWLAGQGIAPAGPPRHPKWAGRVRPCPAERRG